MNLKFLRWIFILLLPLLAVQSTSAQLPNAQCLANLQNQLDRFPNFGHPEIQKIVEKHDFGKMSNLSDPGKARAFKRLFESLSEFCQLCGEDLTEKGLEGYTRFAGGIIRADGTDFVADLKRVFGGQNFDAPGFNKVMEQLQGTGTWLSQGRWQSPSGLIFDVAPANRQGHRLTHVFSHTIEMADTNHTVFSVPREELLKLLDDAWSARPPVNPNDPGGFLIDMGDRIVGTNGEKKILISIDPTNGNILTAYPKL